LAAPNSISFDTLYHRDRRTNAGEVEVEMSRIFRFAAIHVPEFESFRFGALNRKLTVMFAANLGLAADAAQVAEEVRRFRATQGLAGEEAFREWLRKNDLREEEFVELMSEMATCRRVHQWWLSVAGGFGQRVKVVLDELRLAGKYQPAVQGAAELSSAAAEAPRPDVGAWTRTEVAALVREHAAQTGFHLDVPIQRWTREAGYFAFEDLLSDLYLSKASRNIRNRCCETQKEVA
jgi:hypothetical protein